MKPRLHWHASLQIPSLVVDYPNLVLSDLRVSLAFLGCIPLRGGRGPGERERILREQISFILGYSPEQEVQKRFFQGTVQPIDFINRIYYLINLSNFLSVVTTTTPFSKLAQYFFVLFFILNWANRTFCVGGREKKSYNSYKLL